MDATFDHMYITCLQLRVTITVPQLATMYCFHSALHHQSPASHGLNACNCEL